MTSKAFQKRFCIEGEVFSPFHKVGGSPLCQGFTFCNASALQYKSQNNFRTNIFSLYLGLTGSKTILIPFISYIFHFHSIFGLSSIQYIHFSANNAKFFKKDAKILHYPKISALNPKISPLHCRLAAHNVKHCAVLGRSSAISGCCLSIFFR